MYKVRVCYHGKAELSAVNRNHAYYYHADGSSEEIEFATVGPNTIASEEPTIGLSRLCMDIKKRFSELGERDLSRAYIENNIEKIKQLLPDYKRGKVTLAQLLDFEAQDRVIPVYIIELLHAHQSEYDVSIRTEQWVYLYHRWSGTATYSCRSGVSFPAHGAPAEWSHPHGGHLF